MARVAGPCPVPGPHHRNYSKREMAKDMVELISKLGHERFGIVAHDRGARVGYRLALDSPRRVSYFVSLDTVPTLDIWDAGDMAASIESFHWTLLARPAPVPERMMGAQSDFYITQFLDRWASRPDALDLPMTPERAARVAEFYSAAAGPSRRYRGLLLHRRLQSGVVVPPYFRRRRGTVSIGTRPRKGGTAWSDPLAGHAGETLSSVTEST